MRWFKIEIGYDAMDYVPIDETELDKAVYIHLTGKVGAFKEGSVSGKNIIAIRPDWNRAKGWNDGYQPSQDDIADISKVGRYYQGAIEEAKQRVHDLIASGQTDLIGKQDETGLIEELSEVEACVKCNVSVKVSQSRRREWEAKQKMCKDCQWSEPSEEKGAKRIGDVV